MSASVSYSYDREVAIVRAQDHYSLSDLVAIVCAALDDPERPAVRGLLIDLRDSRSFHQRTARDIAHVRDFMESRREHFGARVGLLPPHRAPSGLLKLVSAASEDAGIVTFLFRDVREAREWLRRGTPASPAPAARRTRPPTESSPPPPAV
jgi:hypothetical protein